MKRGTIILNSFWLKFLSDGALRCRCSHSPTTNIPSLVRKNDGIRQRRQAHVCPAFRRMNWWTLRERFKQTMPNRVDADYLQYESLVRSAGSAGNLIGPLRGLGLIDEEGRPSDRALVGGRRNRTRRSDRGHAHRRIPRLPALGLPRSVGGPKGVDKLVQPQYLARRPPWEWPLSIHLSPNKTPRLDGPSLRPRRHRRRRSRPKRLH